VEEEVRDRQGGRWREIDLLGELDGEDDEEDDRDGREDDPPDGDLLEDDGGLDPLPGLDVELAGVRLLQGNHVPRSSIFRATRRTYRPGGTGDRP
jgi:hypothetical protein